MTPERKKVMNEYGKTDQVIEGKAIQEKGKKWSYGLYSVLLFNFPDKVKIERGPDGNLYAWVNPFQTPLVVIDGIPVMGYEYPTISNISPGEVKSFEIIENAKNFSKLYHKAYPDRPNEPTWGDVIAIYTQDGKGIFGANQTVGIVKGQFPYFHLPVNFMPPGTKISNLRIGLNRTCVHWYTGSLSSWLIAWARPTQLFTMPIILERCKWW